MIEQYKKEKMESFYDQFSQKISLKNKEEAMELKDWLQTAFDELEEKVKCKETAKLEQIRGLVKDIYESGKQGDSEDWVDDLLKRIYTLTNKD